MFGRPAAALLSVIPALGLTALFTAYLELGHDFSRLIRSGLVVVVFVASWYGSLMWMMGSGSMKRAVRRVWLALKVLAVAGVVLIGLWVFGYFEPSTDAPPDAPQCRDCPTATVLRIIDGDTLDTNIGRVRLFGIDAPEVGQRCSRDATEELRRLAGDEVRLEDGPRLFDRFDRRLAYLYQMDGDSIDAALIAGGYARAWTRDGQHVQQLIALERGARMANEGCLW